MYILLENRRVGVAGAGVNDENLATLPKKTQIEQNPTSVDRVVQFPVVCKDAETCQMVQGTIHQQYQMNDKCLQDGPLPGVSRVTTPPIGAAITLVTHL